MADALEQAATPHLAPRPLLIGLGRRLHRQRPALWRALLAVGHVPVVDALLDRAGVQDADALGSLFLFDAICGQGNMRSRWRSMRTPDLKTFSIKSSRPLHVDGCDARMLGFSSAAEKAVGTPDARDARP